MGGIFIQQIRVKILYASPILDFRNTAVNRCYLCFHQLYTVRRDTDFHLISFPQISTKRNIQFVFCHCLLLLYLLLLQFISLYCNSRFPVCFTLGLPRKETMRQELGCRQFIWGMISERTDKEKRDNKGNKPSNSCFNEQMTAQGNWVLMPLKSL